MGNVTCRGSELGGIPRPRLTGRFGGGIEVEIALWCHTNKPDPDTVEQACWSLPRTRRANGTWPDAALEMC